ncbi:hypothetical protein B7755_033800 [Streptomyces sp. NBS 14/10]|uniref:hypothetical protein n=1 Tax=Streptomyces sp. NBS 14/10 TaxID=1945643 RepID=UPI000B7EBD36|nr:hypothetical protein [Streptomyces sp. NBS 14/10]KAK1182672.1 hypothetical protein B7755_033800 [Streptomyces sp. NBS 14/10]
MSTQPSVAVCETPGKTVRFPKRTPIGFQRQAPGGGGQGPEELARISPYLTEHINRFGEYSTHELGIQPKAYDPKLNVDFTQLREQAPTAADLGQAA